jgi:hypothetical protein
MAMVQWCNECQSISFSDASLATRKVTALGCNNEMGGRGIQKTSVDSTHDTPAADGWKNQCMGSVAGERQATGIEGPGRQEENAQKRKRETEKVLHGRVTSQATKFDFCPESKAKLSRRLKIDWL